MKKKISVNIIKNDRYLRNKFVFDKWIKSLNINNILDIGCSDNYMKMIHDNVIGIDINGSPDIIFDLEKGNIPIKENSFDCIICLDVLEHVDNLHEVLDQFLLISKKYIILSFPNELRFLNLIRYVYKTNNREFGFFPRNRHKWFISYSQSKTFIRNFAKKNNLIIINDYTNLGYKSKFLFKIIKNKFPNILPHGYYVILKKKI